MAITPHPEIIKELFHFSPVKSTMSLTTTTVIAG